MNKVEEVLKSSKKPKDKVISLTSLIKENESLTKELIECFRNGTDVEKGTCADVMKHVSAYKPSILSPFLEFLIDYINYKAPRVKWGVPESIGNMAKESPKGVEKAIPKLLINTKDESTVIRWCAAFAISEIAKYNKKVQKELVSKINELIKKENNNGVKNVYLKALKFIEKSKT